MSFLWERFRLIFITWKKQCFDEKYSYLIFIMWKTMSLWKIFRSGFYYEIGDIFAKEISVFLFLMMNIWHLYENIFKSDFYYGRQCKYFCKGNFTSDFFLKNLYEARMPFKKKISNLIFDIESIMLFTDQAWLRKI